MVLVVKFATFGRKQFDKLTDHLAPLRL